MCYNYTGREFIPPGHLSSPRLHRLYFAFLSLLSFCSLLINQFCVLWFSFSLYASPPFLFSSAIPVHFPLSISFSLSECFSYRFGVQCSLSRTMKALERFNKMLLSILRESSCFCTASQNAPGRTAAPENNTGSKLFTLSAACSSVAHDVGAHLKLDLYRRPDVSLALTNVLFSDYDYSGIFIH